MNIKQWILLMGFILLIFCAFTVVGLASAKTWYVDDNDGADFTTIQAAVDAASPVDTIEVHSGTYYENVSVNKLLTLRGVDTGSGKPMVDAGGSGSAITLSADGITLEGFKATNSGSWIVDEEAYKH